jgi:hypothetical protein
MSTAEPCPQPVVVLADRLFSLRAIPAGSLPCCLTRFKAAYRRELPTDIVRTASRLNGLRYLALQRAGMDPESRIAEGAGASTLIDDSLAGSQASHVSRQPRQAHSLID